MVIFEGSHKKMGGWNVFALRFRDHCAKMCKFRVKWSRLNLVLLLLLHPTAQGLQPPYTCNEDTKKSVDLRDIPLPEWKFCNSPNFGPSSLAIIASVPKVRLKKAPH
ncbi:hypothetical protein BJV78DRAFT_1235628 [Lactifluus subvellereus]|nr:hypothetical protein BJV78DRAFT_1235628 [Lactifluus subvellereus]